MVRKYETAVIFDGSLPEEAVAKEQKKFEEYLSENYEFHNTEAWGKKDLAYEIDRKRTGYYFLFIFSGEGNINEVITDKFKLDEKVIRTMTVLYEEYKKKDITEDGARDLNNKEEE